MVVCTMILDWEATPKAISHAKDVCVCVSVTPDFASGKEILIKQGVAAGTPTKKMGIVDMQV